MNQTLYLKVSPENTGDLILLCGDPARVDFFTEIFPFFTLISRNREFSIATGEYQGQRFSIVSAGIGAPSTAIALEELKQAGARAVVRIGTMMGLTAPMGSVVIPNGAVCQEGTSHNYLPPGYPAVPHWDLQHDLIAAANQRGLDVHVGLSATFDGFYTHLFPDLAGRQPMDWTEYIRYSVLSVDMETSLIFNLGRFLGLASAAMCLVTVQPGALPKFLDAEERSDLEHSLLVAAMEGLLAFGKAHPG
jgi:uridine phosphorylase